MAVGIDSFKSPSFPPLIRFFSSFLLDYYSHDYNDVIRRLSKDNFRQFGRKLGKLSHANPTIVFHTIIDQLQSYDNMVQPVVDALKYLTNLDFDVLACKCMQFMPGVIN